jgi:DNA-binding LacI/PurR family transcriptional regulator
MPAVRVQKATLNDVAKRCGVSYQTVSRVINNHPHVARETRARVLSAIQALGYRPNRAARSLVTKRSSVIGIISFGTGYYGPAQMVMNIELALKTRGYGLTFSTIDELSLEQLVGAIDDLIGQGVDGIVMITPIAEIDLEAVATFCAEVPFVMIDAELGEHVPSVVIDQRRGAELATRHLIDLGHQAICEISGPLSWHDAKLRHQGWLETLQASGLRPGASLEGDWTAAGGYAAARRLLAGNVEFSALIAGNDQMALGAMRALRERGLEVPGDVSVVGFDDIPEAVYFEPPLTTVRQDFKALGRQSAEYLIALIDTPDMPLRQRVLQPQLVERLSAAKRRRSPAQR